MYPTSDSWDTMGIMTGNADRIFVCKKVGGTRT
jgi:hypothetical protein